MTGESVLSKPSIEEVIAYCDDQVNYFIHKRAFNLPPEQKDEIRQDARLRVTEAYASLDPERGWKSFVQKHCFGAVMDYGRSGDGFEEDSKNYADEKDDAASADSDERKSYPLKVRITICDSETGRDLEVGEIAGIYGIHSESSREEIVFAPKWDVVARMASVDDDIHLVAKILLGFSQTEQAADFNVVRERLSQRIREFFDRLDSPEFMTSRWVNQTIFAFGLSEYFHMPEVDNYVDRRLLPVDLLSRSSVAEAASLYQPSFKFD